MKEETIQEVSKILDEWNPLGEHASTIEDLNGYRTEAIDLTVDEKHLNDAVAKISKIIEK